MADKSFAFASAVFLYLINELNWLGFGLLNLSKLFGILLVWYITIKKLKQMSKNFNLVNNLVSL